MSEIEKAINFIKSTKDGAAIHGDFTTAKLCDTAIKVLQEKQEREKGCEAEYIRFLENMIILMAGCYQSNFDVAVELIKGSEMFMKIKTVQGYSMRRFVEKISKIELKGETIEPDMLEKAYDKLISSRKLGKNDG